MGLILFLLLRDHYPALSVVHCLENTVFCMLSSVSDFSDEKTNLVLINPLCLDKHSFRHWNIGITKLKQASAHTDL